MLLVVVWHNLFKGMTLTLYKNGKNRSMVNENNCPFYVILAYIKLAVVLLSSSSCVVQGVRKDRKNSPRPF